MAAPMRARIGITGTVPLYMTAVLATVAHMRIQIKILKGIRDGNL